MQPVVSRCSSFNNPEPPDVFCGLGSLIVEGRVPVNDDRGFGEGPHVPFPKGRHECAGENSVCKRDENFRKHLLLLWQNNVPLRIEVLLCSPTCRSSDNRPQTPVEFTFIPEPDAILLEQWTVSIRSKRAHPEPFMTGRGLFQAVRSYLHFSQLSAWYSSTKGHEPSNIHYRITIPGEKFSSKFSTSPVEHHFPPAIAGESLVEVTVLSLPRCETIPQAFYFHKPAASSTSTSGSFSKPTTTNQDPSSSPDEEDLKLTMAGSLCWRDSHHPETDLRKAIVKMRLAECSGLDRSDSMDSILGDSLLDPPQSLQKIPPKRYQSPSRCGSPSLEAPDHLLFGHGSSHSRESDTDMPFCGSSRRARQDLQRRRDMTLFGGLHPKVLDGKNRPWTNLKTVERNSKPLLPSPSYTATDADEKSQKTEEDCAFVNCRLSEFGKRSCRPGDVLRRSPDEPSGNPWVPNDQAMLGAKSKQHRKVVQMDNELDDEGEEVVEYPTLTKEAAAEDISKKEFQKLVKNKTVFHPNDQSPDEKDSLDDVKKKMLFQCCFEAADQSFSNLDNQSRITQVYRAETVPHQPFSGDASVEGLKSTDNVDGVEAIMQQQFKAFQNRSKLIRENLRVDDLEVDKVRLRSLSENIATSSNFYVMEPLDISFDNKEGEVLPESIGDSGAYDLNLNNLRSNCKLNGIQNIPSTDAVNTFLKSFDSATSMVFHGRTGLPLTSSPAPLRRGHGKFDYDSAIASPHDIKRALFQSQFVIVNQQKKEIEKDERKRRHSQKLLSASAPATISSTNLLCNFEESVLNGRLEPVSTVEGFTAEIGASGSFHPKHLEVPVTVFFYTLCDNATVSSPYLGHINLGKKGYRVPLKGTIQVTLFNPLGTVVKMFVVMYDLSDMPPNSQTFLRQRTLYMPSDLSEANNIDAQKWLRYLVHLRFASSKSGKLYLHTDIRMIIFRKSDLDTATDHNNGKGYELRSFTKGPTNPKFSPRK